MRTIHNEFFTEEIIITQLQIMRTIHNEFTRQLTDMQFKMIHPTYAWKQNAEGHGGVIT